MSLTGEQSSSNFFGAPQGGQVSNRAIAQASQFSSRQTVSNLFGGIQSQQFVPRRTSVKMMAAAGVMEPVISGEE